jgi:hypothetical protein
MHTLMHSPHTLHASQGTAGLAVKHHGEEKLSGARQALPSRPALGNARGEYPLRTDRGEDHGKHA